MIRFLCGCTSKIEPPITEVIFKTFDAVVRDWQGFLVCLVHHERLMGWRSVPYAALNMPPGISCASWTPLEYERWRIFGEFPKVRTFPLQSEAPDLRDNRDPEQVGREYLAAMAVARNGQPPVTGGVIEQGQLF